MGKEAFQKMVKGGFGIEKKSSPVCWYIEDNAMSQEVLKFQFQYIVKGAELNIFSGIDEIKQVLSDPKCKKPSVVICDYDLFTEENGINAAQYINEKFGKLPTYLFSDANRSKEKDVEAAFESGLLCKQFKKPVQIKELLAQIRYDINPAKLQVIR